MGPRTPTSNIADTLWGKLAIRWLAAMSVAVAFLALLQVAGAQAAPPAHLTTFPENTKRGAEADRLGVPTAVVSDPAMGDVYVAESSNNRISQFDAWGEFVRSIGWDVAPGAVNELQEIRLRATAGQFTLEFSGETTTDLPFDATAAQLEAALNDLSTISAGGGAVAVSGGPGGIPGTTPSVYYVAFKEGPIAATDVDELIAGDGAVPLSGGQPSTLLSARTLAPGTGPAVGLEVCTAESECQAGVADSSPGQLSAPNGLALDSGGNLIVLERSNVRVQKLTVGGEFLLMFGGEVNKTTGGNVCDAADLAGGDVCGVGVKGTAHGYFEPPTSFVRDYIATNDSGSIYVGDKDRVQVFQPNGVFDRAVPLPEPGNPGSLEIDPVTGAIYFSYFLVSAAGTFNPLVYMLDPSTGEVLATRTLEWDTAGKIEALTVESNGDLFVAFDPTSTSHPAREPRVAKFAANGELLIALGEEFAAPPVSPSIFDAVLLMALGANEFGNLYVAGNSPGGGTASASAYGPPPLAYGPPPNIPPAIVDQFATAVLPTSATIKGAINPRFWADTTYYVEYGEEDCAEGPCLSQPASPGLTLTDEVVNSALPTKGISLADLTPGTTYHYRLVSQSTGGGPIYGPDRTFQTPKVPTKPPPCPNQAFRPGSAAFLPDCRAYEMVSPVDKLGADISVVFTSAGYPASLNQASTDGEKISFSAYRAFADPESAPYTSQYLASRGANSWQASSISPPRSGPSLYSAAGLDTQFHAFSADLCQGWLLQDADSSLAPGSVDGWPNIYRRQNCGGVAYEALVPGQAPQLASPNDFIPILQGISDDGAKAIVSATGKLTRNASTASQLYEVSDGKLSLACILPNGSAFGGGCSAGTGATLLGERVSTVENALSRDGSHVYWTDSPSSVGGNIYVRVDGAETIAVSSGSARFWTAATDGSAAAYSEGGALKLFDLGSESSTPVAGGFEGVMGASDDLTKIYLVSREDLAGDATSGAPNLYLYEVGEPGEFTFIATLSEGDMSSAGLSPISPRPVDHSAQVTADGGAVAFMSVARPGLTGYDNTDVANGKPDAQVYVYRADGNALVCASCNPTGARPSGREIRPTFWAAARIPAAELVLHTPRAISEDGSRLFFESFDALSPRDTNKKQDVYQWQAEGAGSCTGAAPGHYEAFQGCVELITTGGSPEDSFLVDSSADGRDVFVKTESSLRPEDPGLVDIYDARAGGGLPGPAPAPVGCIGEACQRPPPAPEFQAPASNAYSGPGNFTRSAGAAARCNRAARAARRLSRRAGKLRRAARRGQSPPALRRKRARAARRSARSARRLSRSAKRCRARARAAGRSRR